MKDHVAREVYDDLLKEARRLRKEVCRLKNENRWLEEQMVFSTRNQMETARRDAQRRAAEAFVGLLGGE